MTPVLIEKGLVFEGWLSKIEVSWVLGIYIIPWELFSQQFSKYIPFRFFYSFLEIPSLRESLLYKSFWCWQNSPWRTSLHRNNENPEKQPVFLFGLRALHNTTNTQNNCNLQPLNHCTIYVCPSSCWAWHGRRRKSKTTACVDISPTKTSFKERFWEHCW